MSAVATGQFVGWLGVGLVDALMMALTSGRRTISLGVRGSHYAYDAALAVAAGLVSLAAVEAWRRLAPNRARLDVAVLGVAAITVGALVLPEDVSGLAGRIPGPRPLAQALVVVAVSLVVPAVAAAARAVLARGSSPPRRATAHALAIVAGVAMAAANHFVLRRDYEGVHIFVSWTAALVMASAFSTDRAARVEQATTVWAHRRDVWRAIGALSLALTIAATLAVKPPNSVTIDLIRVTGGSLAPWVVRAHGTNHTRAIAPAWFSNHVALPPVPPSDTPLLPKGGIVVLLTVDALRADVVTNPQYRSRFPNFAALREQSVAFDRARSVAPGTSASIASIFSGKYFSQLYWTSKAGSPLVSPHRDPSIRFPVLLATAGVSTVLFTGMPGLLNDIGIACGFTEQTVIPGSPWATAPMIVEPMLPRLRRQGADPLFLYVHVTDPHAPYDKSGATGTEFERYLGEVAVVDAQLGRVLRTIADTGLEGRTAFILSADHGEAFGEHDTHYHATTVYEELLRVPLLIRAPGVQPRVVDDPVSLIDLGPTVLDLMGLATPASFMGQSLTGYLRGDHPKLTRPLMAESSRGKLAMVFPDSMKAIRDFRADTCELYDLSSDPGEIVNLAEQRALTAAERCALLDGFRTENEAHFKGYTTPYVR